MQAETPVTQLSPCYSAVSALLMNPLPDCSNYSPFCHTHYLILWMNTSLVSRARSFSKPNTQRFTAESSRELMMSSDEFRSALRKLNNKQRQVVMFLLLLFKLSSQLPFVSFLFSLTLSSLCSLSQSSLFSLFSFPLASPPSFLYLLINSLSA